MRELLEEQTDKQTSQLEDLRLRFSEEMDRVAFLERERACHVEVRSLPMISESSLISVSQPSTPCPRKNCTPIYVAITLANNSDFNEILRRH